VQHQSLRHPNIVQLLGISLDPPSVIMEFMSRGSLAATLRDDSLSLTFKQRLSFAMDVSLGMHFLAEKELVHMDLKSMNVLINDDWRCKVADFGQTRRLVGGASLCVVI
jgi:serine/threonine protein kinase